MEDSNLKGYFPAAGYFYLGEAYSRRDEAGDDKKAFEAYKKAERMSPGFAPTYMRLGMHHMKKGDKGNARQYFNRYLSLAPKDASDRSYVQQYLNSL
jgi:cytochrome c-type biogenesis protein CcmH/NrfG